MIWTVCASAFDCVIWVEVSCSGSVFVWADTTGWSMMTTFVLCANWCDVEVSCFSSYVWFARSVVVSLSVEVNVASDVYVVSSVVCYCVSSSTVFVDLDELEVTVAAVEVCGSLAVCCDWDEDFGFDA